MRFFLCVILGLGPLLVPGTTIAETPDTTDPYSRDLTILEIDGEEMSLGEVMDRYARLSPNLRARYDQLPDGFTLFIEEMAANIAVSNEAEDAGLAEGALFESLMKIKREEALRDLDARSKVLSSLTDEFLREVYEEQKGRFELSEQIRLNYILVTVAPADPNQVEDRSAKARRFAEGLRESLLAGEDFSRVARRGSDDVSADSGGNIGWIERGTLDPVIEKIAFNTEIGEISPVFESQLGFHVVQVTDRHDAGELSFEVVRELLFQEAVLSRADEFHATAERRRQEIKKRHEIKVFYERIP